jgi:hypothetical protein
MEKQPMCDIIEMTTRRRFSKMQLGMIDVYPTRTGTVGIDACVPAVVVSGVLATNVPVTRGENGMVSFDACLPAHIAAQVLERARQAGVSIRR